MYNCLKNTVANRIKFMYGTLDPKGLKKTIWDVMMKSISEIKFIHSLGQNFTSKFSTLTILSHNKSGTILNK